MSKWCINNCTCCVTVAIISANHHRPLREDYSSLSVCLPACLSVCLSVCLTVSQSVHLSVCLFIRPSVSQSICQGDLGLTLCEQKLFSTTVKIILPTPVCLASFQEVSLHHHTHKQHHFTITHTSSITSPSHTQVAIQLHLSQFFTFCFFSYQL